MAEPGEAPTAPAEGPPPELQLGDDKAEKGFVSWYRSLPDDPTIVRFFDRKGYYSVHGPAALDVSRHVYKTTAQVKHLGGGGQDGAKLEGVTLNVNVFAGVLQWLLLQRCENCVEVYEGSGASWKLARRGSPGRLGEFEEELTKGNAEVDSSVVAAVVAGLVDGVRTVGVAYADLAGRRLGAAEFADDEQLCTLEAALVQLGAKECVLPGAGADGGSSSSTDARRLTDLLQRCNVLASVRPKQPACAVKGLEPDLGRLLRGGGVEQHRDILQRGLASQALAAVIAFTELMADAEEHGKYSLSLYDPGRYMRLDVAAQRALHVMRSREGGASGHGGGGAGGDGFSLFGLLNRAKTPMGKRLLKAWLKQPLVRLEDIRGRHDVVEAFASDAELRTRLRDTHFRGLPDVERLVRKLDRKKATLVDLCGLYRASSKLQLVADTLREHQGKHSALLEDRYASLLAKYHDEEHLTKYEELVEAAVDLDRVPDEYLVSADYNDELQELSGEKADLERRIADLAADAASDLGLVMDKTIKLEWHKSNNARLRCLRITQKEEKAVRSKLQARYTMLETRKDGTKFTNAKLRRAAEELQGLTRRYDDVQRDLVEQVVAVAHTFVEVWESVSCLLAELDVLLGFAELAVVAPTPYVRPDMLPASEGRLVLKACRHPCVEAQEGHQEFIANDCVMERGSSWFQIITGPNMGGKSTFIRQVGVNVLMAQVGSFVPCSEAIISVRDAIFARVGAGDCQLRGVSTFMAEMLETAAILKGATSRSLVIIDELGRGTSTYDGFGLAWAISEALMRDVACPTLFATHFHELTALGGPGGVKNLHVETSVDPGTGKLCMLYKVKDGFSDQSFGIHVAEYAGFPKEVVQLAQAKAQELEEWGGGEAIPALHQPPSSSSPTDATAAIVGGKRGREGEDGGSVGALEGKVAVRDFLEEFAGLPLDELAPQEALGRVQAMYRSLRECLPPAAKQQLLAA